MDASVFLRIQEPINGCTTGVYVFSSTVYLVENVTNNTLIRMFTRRHVKNIAFAFFFLVYIAWSPLLYNHIFGSVRFSSVHLFENYVHAYVRACVCACVSNEKTK